MKTVGIAMIFCAALLAYFRHRRAVLQKLTVIRALSDDLALLRCRICVHRRPLPSILRDELCKNASTAVFWSHFAATLEQTDMTVRCAWESTAHTLPEPLCTRLTPLGALLTIGGDTLAAAIDEIRSELLEHAKNLQEDITVNLRLTAAMLLGCAAWFILIFV